MTWSRTFTRHDVDRFTELSGDSGFHHVESAPDGRVMVHGLLTATLPTKIGGDMNYVAREISFNFLRPVFTGDTITCEVTLTSVERAPERTAVEATFRCWNQHGQDVLAGRTTGVVLQPA